MKPKFKDYIKNNKPWVKYLYYGFKTKDVKKASAAKETISFLKRDFKYKKGDENKFGKIKRIIRLVEKS